MNVPYTCPPKDASHSSFLYAGKIKVRYFLNRVVYIMNIALILINLTVTRHLLDMTVKKSSFLREGRGALIKGACYVRETTGPFFNISMPYFTENSCETDKPTVYNTLPMKSSIFFDIMQCSLKKVNKCFRETTTSLWSQRVNQTRQQLRITR
jgi:hypothetical protein